MITTKILWNWKVSGFVKFFTWRWGQSFWICFQMVIKLITSAFRMSKFLIESYWNVIFSNNDKFGSYSGVKTSIQICHMFLGLKHFNKPCFRNQLMARSRKNDLEWANYITNSLSIFFSFELKFRETTNVRRRTLLRKTSFCPFTPKNRN